MTATMTRKQRRRPGRANLFEALESRVLMDANWEQNDTLYPEVSYASHQWDATPVEVWHQTHGGGETGPWSIHGEFISPDFPAFPPAYG